MTAKIIYKHITPKGVFETWDDKPPFSVYHMKQTHSDFVAHLDPAQHNNLSEGDGLYYTGKESLNLAIITADCLPILFIGTKGVAMVHAGWKGLAQNILEKSELKSIGPQLIHIGPHISASKYEVQMDFHHQFPHSNAFFTLGTRLYFDLEKEAKDQLEKRYPYAEIQSSGICTFSDPHFHSFRRDGTTLRNWNVFKYNQE